MYAGLGIDFNPPPSPPVAASSSEVPGNPALARIQRQAALGHAQSRSFSDNNALARVQLAKESQQREEQQQALGHQPRDRAGSIDVTATLGGRKVRIVSAANIYHEDTTGQDANEVSPGHEEYEDQEEELYRTDDDVEEDEDDVQDYQAEDDILDGYSDCVGDYGQLTGELGPEPSPMPTQQTTAMSVRSMSAVSSGSSTRLREAASMDQIRHLKSARAEQFEADVRGQHMQPNEAQPCQEAQQPLTRVIQSRPHPMDLDIQPTRMDMLENPPDNVNSAWTRKQMPPPMKSGLRRAPAMSRPKSMMELSQLYAYQSIQDNSAVPALVHSHYYDIVGIPMEPSKSRTSTVDSASSPLSLATSDSYGMGSSSSASTAPSSIHGSSEIKSEPSFLAKHSSQQAPGVRSHQLVKARSAISMRSAASMRGLEPAETGGAAIVLDALGKGFSEGLPFDPRHAGELRSPPVVPEMQRQARQRAISVATSRAPTLSSLNTAPQNLQRQSTLLSAGANPTKRAKELERLLAPKQENVKTQYSGSLQPYDSADLHCQPVFEDSGIGGTSFNPVGASGYQPGLKRKPSTVVLEQAVKGKARVELDLVLAGTLVVEGGLLKGRMEVKVRREKDGEGEVWLGTVKARIIGFEELSGHEECRHVFYHHSAQIDNVVHSDGLIETLPCYSSIPDDEGFCKGKVGNHSFPFSMPLPTGKGAKGSMKCKQGVVKYIVIGSVKLKSHVGTDRSIAHFYRHVDVFPYLNPSLLLAPAAQPLRAESSKALFMGGSGKVKLSASLHRSTWVAGQRCYVDIRVHNDGSKKIKTLTLSLTRTTTVFRPRPYLTAGNGRDENDPVEADVDADACQTQTNKKKVAEETLDMGKKHSKGNVTAKGMWMGVDKGEDVEFCHYLQVPPDALTIERGRYLEVTYQLKVSVSGSLSSDISVELPARIVNFVSIDPPPGHAGPAAAEAISAERKPASADDGNHMHRTMSEPQQTSTMTSSAKVSRMTSMDSLNLVDLNRMYGLPSLPRTYSYDSTSSSGISSSYSMSRAATLPVPSMDVIPEGTEAGVDENSPPLPAMAQVVVQRAEERQVRHRMSLDCIGSAIASATARRMGGNSRTNSAVSVAQPIPEEAAVMEHSNASEAYPAVLPEPRSVVQLDDLDDIPDNEEEFARSLPYQQVQRFSQTLRVSAAVSDDWLEYENESEDEVDMVLQTKHFESDEEVENRRPLSPAGRSHSPAPTTNTKRPVTPLSPARPGHQRRVVAPASPALASRPSSSLSQHKRSMPSSPAPNLYPVARANLESSTSTDLQFGLATPASPVKKGHAAIVSPPAKSRPRVGQNSLAPSLTAATSPRPSPAFMSPTATPRKVRATGTTAVSPRPSSTVPTNGPSPSASVRTKIAALEAVSPAKKAANSSPAMRKMHSMSSLASFQQSHRPLPHYALPTRRVSPSAVSAVSSVSPVSLDWRLNGGAT